MSERREVSRLCKVIYKKQKQLPHIDEALKFNIKTFDNIEGSRDFKNFFLLKNFLLKYGTNDKNLTKTLNMNRNISNKSVSAKRDNVKITREIRDIIHGYIMSDGYVRDGSLTFFHIKKYFIFLYERNSHLGL